MSAHSKKARGIECEGLHRESVQRSASVCGRRKCNFSWSSSDCHWRLRLVVAAAFKVHHILWVTIFRPPAITSDHLGPSVRFDSTPQSPTSILGAQQLVVLLLDCDGDFGCSECAAISKGLLPQAGSSETSAELAGYVVVAGVLDGVRVGGILDILKGTFDFGLVHSTNFISDKARGFCDVEIGGDIHTRRSCTGYVFQVVEALTAWNSKGQKHTVASTTEAEHIAACTATVSCRHSTEISYSNSWGQLECNTPSKKNPEFHKRTKHIDIQYHFIREKYHQQEIDINYVSAHNQIVDIMTKPFTQGRTRSIQH